MNAETNSQLLRSGVTVLVALAVALSVTFVDALAEMVRDWALPEYNHGYAIPFIATYLLWIKASDMAKMSARSSWLGVCLVGIAVVFYLAGKLSAIFVISQYAFLLALWGAVLALFGFRITALLWASLAYLVFMVPLPRFLQWALTDKLQLLSSELGTSFLRLMGVTVYLEGNIIDLGNYKLQVVEACSGLRYLFPLMSLAFLFAYLFKAENWKRVTVFLSAIPITVLMNSFRIAVIGLLVNNYGNASADGFLHFFEGWVVFMACIAILLGEMWILGRLGARSDQELFAVEVPPWSDFRTVASKVCVAAASWVTVFLIALGAIFGIAIETREEAMVAREPLSRFPLQVGDWRGRETTLSDAELEALRLTDYVMANYRRSAAEPSMELYVAYYANQRQGASVHSPRACMPAGGWKIESLSIKYISEALPDGDLPVNRAVIGSGGQRLLVYYWFEQRGRQLTNEYLVKWFIFWDSIAMNRTDGALVRVMTPVPDPAVLGEADARLTEFVRDVAPRLYYHVPGAVPVDSKPGLATARPGPRTAVARAGPHLQTAAAGPTGVLRAARGHNTGIGHTAKIR